MPICSLAAAMRVLPQRYRFNDLSYCPLIEPSGTVELVMAGSPEREGGLQKAFLDFMRGKKEFIRQ